MVIAGIYTLVPRGPIAFAVVRGFSVFCTALAGALSVWLSYDVMRRIHNGAGLPMLAAGTTLSLAMLDRTVRTYSVDFLTEPMAMLLSIAIAFSLMRWQEQKRPWLWFSSLVGSTVLLILTRSIAVFWLPGLALLVALLAREGRTRWSFLFLVSVVLIMSPWWVRNCLVLHRFMPMGGQGAASLRGGYCDEAYADRGNWHGNAENRLQQELDSIPGSTAWTQAQREVALAERASGETWAWVLSNRAKIPSLIVQRVVTHWGPYHGTSLLWRLAILVGWLGLLALHRRECLWILGLPIISTATVAVLYETGGRFLVPWYPLLYMTAGIGAALSAWVVTCVLRTIGRV
jgi:hypothetical protein